MRINTTDIAGILITLLPMFRKLLLVGGFDMVQLIHITNGPIHLAHRIQQSISKVEIRNFDLNNVKLTNMKKEL